MGVASSSTEQVERTLRKTIMTRFWEWFNWRMKMGICSKTKRGDFWNTSSIRTECYYSNKLPRKIETNPSLRKQVRRESWIASKIYHMSKVDTFRTFCPKVPNSPSETSSTKSPNDPTTKSNWSALR